MNPPSQFRFRDPDSALSSLAERCETVTVISDQSPDSGRILGNAVMADRDSPAADVSAMDGYAIRLADLVGDQPVEVSAESAPGAPPPDLRSGTAIRIFTGALVPKNCEAIVKREETEELDGAVRFLESAKATLAGAHIRRAGENAKAGSQVLSAGLRITPAVRATMANFGCDRVNLFSKVRVSIITTGDEVGAFDAEGPKPWQLRNSNRESLSTLLESIPWVHLVNADHCRDDRDVMRRLLTNRIECSDAILLTGGVSMGDYDYVPDVIREIGGHVEFHGLPIRPGKPILGAATADGKLIMGLPGNPVSATVGCRRMAKPLLAKIGGCRDWRPLYPSVRLIGSDSKTIPLHWMRLVRLVEPGVAELVPSQGSGDLVSLGASSGFVELPPGESGEGPWPYIAWQ